MWKRSAKRWTAGLAFALTALVAGGCGRQSPSPTRATAPLPPAAAVQPAAPTPEELVLIPQLGDSRLDRELARQQDNVRHQKNRFPALEKLGWLFVAKARVSFDPGYYKLAEQCALLLPAHSPEALLLRGYILQNLHHFKEAEPLARELVSLRDLPSDYGLLGDVLMEQGRLDEAVQAYQHMADLRPDLQACARAAHVRWLKGDLDGAIEMMHTAIQAASPRDADSAAWVYTRMALYQMQAGALESARQYCQGALDFQSNYPPALLVTGRLALQAGESQRAVAVLRRAAELNPLPEYQWALLEALQAEGNLAAAATVKRDLEARGAATDPRTFALYLAGSGEDSAQALRLARAELQTRADVFTYDALAWALAATGDWTTARRESVRALAEGTRDARLFLHAGIIAAHVGCSPESQRLLRQAQELRQMLLPSENRQLAHYLSPTLSLPQAMRIQTHNQNQKDRS